MNKVYYGTVTVELFELSTGKKSGRKSLGFKDIDMPSAVLEAKEIMNLPHKMDFISKELYGKPYLKRAKKDDFIVHQFNVIKELQSYDS